MTRTPPRSSDSGPQATRSTEELRGRDLARDIAWLRRLAGALVRDAAAADDLVQDALSAAVTRPEPIVNLRGFLAGTIRRLASRTRRADARRAVREAATSEPESARIPGADELAERVDTLRAVLEELEKLPPSQRRAVSLRFLEDMSPGEIAASEGSAPSTVRAHLARGLTSLRERLDARSGGRESWTLAIAAWACPQSLIASGAAAGNAAAGKASAGSATKGSAIGAKAATAAVGTGALMMTGWKLTTLVLVPLCAATAWIMTHDGPKQDPAVRRQSAAESNGADALADVTARGARDAAPAAKVLDRPVEFEGRGVVAAEPAPLHPLRGVVIDPLTREPVPFLRIAFSGHAGLAGAMPDSTNGTGPGSVEAVTDAVGAFEVDDLSLATGTLGIRAMDSEVQRRREPVIRNATFPLESPLEIAVGPTFALALVGGHEVPLESLMASYVPAGTTPEISRFETEIRVGPCPVPGAGDAPWIRFPSGVTALEASLEWEVVVSDSRGFWFGRASATRTTGIEPVPLEIVLEPRGGIEFRLLAEDGAERAAVRIDLQSVATGDTQRVFLGQHSPDGLARGFGRRLVAGDYRWTTVPGESTGTVEVLAREVALVEITTEQLGATFDTHVEIDTTLCPEADPSRWLILVARADDPSTGFMTAPTRVAEGTRTAWRIELPGLADGRWNVAIDPEDSVMLDSNTTQVGPGDPPAVLTARRKPTPLPVHVVAVDAATGAPLANAEAAYMVSPQELGELNSTGAGTFEPALVQEGATVTFCVRARGYRLTTADVRVDEPGVAHEVRLERGWRGRVLVVDVMTQSPVEGVRVTGDGEAAGTTDVAGCLWIEGEAPPRRLEISTTEPALEVIVSPMDSPDGLALEPIHGWIFAVARS